MSESGVTSAFGRGVSALAGANISGLLGLLAPGASRDGFDTGITLPQGIVVKIEQLQMLLAASPFAPFSLVMPNGERLRVPHADFSWVHPGKRSVVVALKGDGVRIVNWQMVTAIETKAAAV